MMIPCPFSSSWDCQCRMESMHRGVGGFALYPRSNLVAAQGMLFQFWGCHSIGPHLLGSPVSGSLRRVYGVVYLRVEGHFANGRRWFVHGPVKGVGLHRVRRIQRWWRGVMWLRRREHVLAFVMGACDRRSPLAALGDDVLRICLC